MSNSSATSGVTIHPTAESLTGRHPGREDTHGHRYSPSLSCQSLPTTMSNLAFSSASPLPVLAFLRVQVLSYLADLEERVALLESPISAESMISKGEHTMEEATDWAKTALELLRDIREDVRSHLPDVNLDSVPSVGQFVKSHMPDTQTLHEMRARAPSFTVRNRLNDLATIRSRLEDVRSRISDIDFNKPLDYIPTLCEHLNTLQSHLSSVELPQSFSESITKLKVTPVYDLIDRLLSLDFESDIAAEGLEGEDKIHEATIQIARAAIASMNGARLITYAELPDKWRNNHFVTRGYRFIPIEQWHRLIGSWFAWHNETINIHTHLIPFLYWSLTLIPIIPSLSSHLPVETELPTVAYMSFALLTLFASTIWHTMSGCAHMKGMELCARADYISIGWLISASTGSIVYYGFECYPNLCQLYLSLCAMFCVSSTVMPFSNWFNERKYRPYRHAFFVALFFFSWVPLSHLSYLHSIREMLDFMRPITYSLYWFFLGFFFYASHFPESLFVRYGEPHWLDWVGGGSHAIWHICVVLGVAFHRAGLQELKKGFIPGQVCAI